MKTEPSAAMMSKNEDALQRRRNVLSAVGDLDPRNELTDLYLPGNKLVQIPTAMLVDQDSAESSCPSAKRFEGTLVIPVVEERLHVEKQTVITGKVLIEKQVLEYEETLDVPLAMRTFEVERVVVNLPVETAPEIRQEGDTTIYPVVEEQLVITTQLVLKEELRVTKHDTERRDNRSVTLKRETINVKRS